MRTYKILFVFVIAIIFISCGGNSKNRSVVQGEITGYGEQKIYLSELGVEDLSVVDSTVTSSNGEFSIEVFPDEAGLYILFLGPREIPLVIDAGQTINIRGDVESIMDSYSVTGSQECLLLNNYENFTKQNEKVIDSLGSIFEQSQNDPNINEIAMQLNQTFDKIHLKQKQFVKNFIDMNPGNLASLLIMYQGFGNTKILDIKEDYEYFKKVDHALMKSYPGNAHVEENHKRMLEFENIIAEEEKSLAELLPGKPGPDVTINDTTGTPVTLSSFKGKEVLLYIWGAWDAKSRQANKELKVLYSDYKRKGFEIYAVSIDMYKEMWIEAINADQLNWINVCDNEGIQSPVLYLYRIPEVLPYYVLIDKEGIIQYRGEDINGMKEILIRDLK